MNTDFENRLQRQPLRELPRDWRAGILAAASVPTSGAVRCRAEAASTWPSFRAWVTLGAAWVVIFLLHFTSPEEPRLARNSAPMTLQTFAMLHEQTMRMADLLGQTDADEPPAALPAPPQPRSQRAPRQLIG
jgi:hypothetical protein